jgi:hypothetical protein
MGASMSTPALAVSHADRTLAAEQRAWALAGKLSDLCIERGWRDRKLSDLGLEAEALTELLSDQADATLGPRGGWCVPRDNALGQRGDAG